jgi:uncharacterized protein
MPRARNAAIFPESALPQQFLIDRTTIMKKLLVSIAVMLAPVLCKATPPTDESIMRLFHAMKAESMIDGMYAGLEPTIRQSIAQAMAGGNLTEQQKIVLSRVPERMSEVLRIELRWEKMLPMMLGIYRSSYDQAEIDGLIVFYTSPIGQSYVSKMPKVMQETTVATQQYMLAVYPRLRAAMNQLYIEANLQPPR